MSLHHLPRGVELEQLVGHVTHRLLDGRFRACPGRAAESVEFRLRVSAARVLLNEIQILHRHQQLAAAGVLDLHHFAFVRSERNPLEPKESSDAVIDVHDEVADFQIAQIGDEGVGFAFLRSDARRGRRLEEVPFRIERDADLLEGEAAGEGAVRDDDLVAKFVRVRREWDVEFFEQTFDFFDAAFGRGEEELAILRFEDVGGEVGKPIRVAIGLRRVDAKLSEVARDCHPERKRAIWCGGAAIRSIRAARAARPLADARGDRTADMHLAQSDTRGPDKRKNVRSRCQEFLRRVDGASFFNGRFVLGAKKRLVLCNRHGDLIRLDQRERPAVEHFRECRALDRGGDVMLDAGERAVLIEALDLLGDVAFVDRMIEVERHAARQCAARFTRERKVRHRQNRHRP